MEGPSRAAPLFFKGMQRFRGASRLTPTQRRRPKTPMTMRSRIEAGLRSSLSDSHSRRDSASDRKLTPPLRRRAASPLPARGWEDAAASRPPATSLAQGLAVTAAQVVSARARQ